LVARVVAGHARGLDNRSESGMPRGIPSWRMRRVGHRLRAGLGMIGLSGVIALSIVPTMLPPTGSC
jgi:hypothetical protein